MENAYIESFNGKSRDECLNEHWFTSLAHARDVIEGFQRHHLPPAGLISRYSPQPSNSLKAFACGLAERILVSVSGMWGQLPFNVSLLRDTGLSEVLGSLWKG